MDGVNLKGEEEGATNCIGVSSLADIFMNHVLMESVIAHLDHTTIKTLTLVNSSLKRIVRTDPSFINRSKFQIRKYETRRWNDGTNRRTLELNPLEFPWKEVCIEFDYWTEQEFAVLLHLLPEVETVELKLGHSYWRAENVGKMLVDTIDAAKKMTKLTIEFGSGALGSSGRPCSYITKHLDQLENLKKVESLHVIDVAGRRIESHGRDMFKLLKAFFPLTSSFTSFTFKGEGFYNKDNLEERVVELTERHKDSLKSLFVAECIWDTKQFAAIMFPRLTCLSLKAKGSMLVQVAFFLGNQPTLKKLEMKFSGEVDSVHPLLAPLAHHASTLEKFSLYWMLKDQEATFNFSLLNTFVKLVEVKISQVWVPLRGDNMQRQNPVTPPGVILSNLSDGVQKIELAGVADGDIQLAMIENLGRFKNLTVLDFVHSGDCLNDDSLAFICTYIPLLQALGFACCENVTDFGLTGKNVEGAKVHPGIKGLNGLTKLRIISCPNVTSAGCLSAISFRHLKNLTLIFLQSEAPQKVQFCLALVNQNEMLEVLTIGPSVWNENQSSTSCQGVSLIQLYRFQCDWLARGRDLDQQIKQSSHHIRKVFQLRDEFRFMPEFSEDGLGQYDMSTLRMQAEN